MGTYATIAYTLAKPITPDDANPIPFDCSGIYVGGTGNITCRFSNMSADTVINGVPAGAILPFSLSHIRAAGTTATGIVGLS